MNAYLNIICEDTDNSFWRSEITGRLAKQVIDDNKKDKELWSKENLVEKLKKASTTMQTMIARTDHKNKFLTSRYIFYPLHDEVKFHWSLLVLDTNACKIHHYNSLWIDQNEQLARTAATLIEWYTIACCGNEIGGIEYIKELTVRQQDDGYSCAVFVCLWAECLIKEIMDTSVDIYLKRAQMTLTVLRHKY
ncbi:hypothetical protein Droror1_Dr00021463 [Drosera rotundifolia]